MGDDAFRPIRVTTERDLTSATPRHQRLRASALRTIFVRSREAAKEQKARFIAGGQHLYDVIILEIPGLADAADGARTTDRQALFSPRQRSSGGCRKRRHIARIKKPRLSRRVGLEPDDCPSMARGKS